MAEQAVAAAGGVAASKRSIAVRNNPLYHGDMAW